jgi:hypothetical protein
MYQYFRTNKNLGLVHSVFDLGKVQWLGDKHIETFRNNWDSMLAGISVDMDEKLLAEALLQQLDKSDELKDEVKAYRRMREDDEEKTYDYLLGIIDRHLEHEAEKRNRANLEKTMSVKPGTALPGSSKEVCQKFLAGRCKKGGACKYAHPEGQKGLKPPPKKSSEGGDKNKGRGRSQSRGQSRTRGRSKSRNGGDVDLKKFPCYYFQDGKCVRDPCPYAHRKATKAELEDMMNRGRSRSPSAGNKLPCNNWKNTGSCVYGDGCRFSHDARGGTSAAPSTGGAAEPKGKAKGKPKAKAKAKAES